ncbi:MAG: acyltransferase family protein [Acidimicrobiales bacterium]
MAATSTAAPDVAATGPEPGSLRSRNREVEGLRAVAALAVLVTHVSLNAMGNRGPFGGLLARLDVGVAVFFVLSGYLLYRPFARSLLRAEPRPRTRRYLRHRLLRIVPAYWVVVAASFLLPAVGGLVLPTTDFSAAAAGATSVPLRDLARFATFTQVYWRDSLAGPFPQAWTLATEMAFYLFLPVLAWAVARRNRGDRPARLRRQWLVLGALAAVAQLFRLAVVAWSAPYQPGRRPTPTPSSSPGCRTTSTCSRSGWPSPCSASSSTIGAREPGWPVASIAAWRSGGPPGSAPSAPSPCSCWRATAWGCRARRSPTAPSASSPATAPTSWWLGCACSPPPSAGRGAGRSAPPCGLGPCSSSGGSPTASTCGRSG